MKLWVLLGLLLALPVSGQEWPRQKPVQLVIGFAPGATTDTVARLAAAKLQDALGQAFVAENRPGAGGNVATQHVKRAAAGRLHAAGHERRLRGQPEPLRERGLRRAEGLQTAKVDITHVPFQPAQAVGAAVAGHTQISSTSMPPAVPQVKAGKVRAIAVTSARRSAALPEVPTVNEQGYSGFDDLTWVGFFAPAGTPPEIISRANSELNKAFAAPDVRERLSALGLESKPNSPAEFAAFLREEVAKWAKAVKESGAKAD